MSFHVCVVPLTSHWCLVSGGQRWLAKVMLNKWQQVAVGSRFCPLRGPPCGPQPWRRLLRGEMATGALAPRLPRRLPRPSSCEPRVSHSSTTTRTRSAQVASSGSREWSPTPRSDFSATPPSARSPWKAFALLAVTRRTGPTSSCAISATPRGWNGQGRCRRLSAFVDVSSRLPCETGPTREPAANTLRHGLSNRKCRCRA